MSVKEQLLQKFETGELDGMSVERIARVLSIPYREKNRLASLLFSLADEGKIETDGERFGKAETLGLIKGKIVGNERGFAFLVAEDKAKTEKDLFIPAKRLLGAYHGNTVLAKRVSGRSDDEAEVVRILERGMTELVGSFYKERDHGVVVPDEKRFSDVIYIPLRACRNIRDGVKAVVRITDYPFRRSPSGEIVEVLGEEGDFFAEELSVIRSFSLREEFPENVEREAERVANRPIPEGELSARRDLRALTTVTIDGEDTRDIDDAVSIEKKGKNYLLGVHIADVSYFVKEGSALDKEAYARGTSVYFPDRVLPMLPRPLSNGVCSLDEGKDRLALSCFIEVDEKGKTVGREIVKSVIRSNKRMTYTQTEKILNGDETEGKNCPKEIAELLFLLKDLTLILSTARQKRGSVELDLKEAKILFDPKKCKITIPDYERLFSYSVIEECMVLANETVASYIEDVSAPFIYRIHEKPAPEKAENFLSFALSLGLNARFSPDDVKPYDYRKLLLSAKDLPVYPVLNRVMLRSMQKARYSSVNVGHFGLASKSYCHFTSPIRRYPDLTVHRILKGILDGRYEETLERFNPRVSEIADSNSASERKATDAERAVDALYETMYMSDKIGEEFPAVISGVTEHGLFAELANTVEGKIPIETLDGEFTLIEDKFLLKGTKTSYRIGEEIVVKVAGVDFYERRTTFTLVGKKEEIL